MVLHQAIRVEVPAELLDDIAQDEQEPQAILVGPEDRGLRRAPCGDVVVTARDLHAIPASHDASVGVVRSRLQTPDVTDPCRIGRWRRSGTVPDFRGQSPFGGGGYCGGAKGYPF